MKNTVKSLMLIGILCSQGIPAFTQTTAPENFDTFIQKFSKDRAFQLSRTKFPFRTEIHADYDEKPEIRFTQRSQWKKADYTKPEEFKADGTTFMSIWHKRSFKGKTSTTERLTACGCEACECGWYVENHFRRIEGKWFLVQEIYVSL